jgi:hypothetical protein
MLLGGVLQHNVGTDEDVGNRSGGDCDTPNFEDLTGLDNMSVLCWRVLSPTSPFTGWILGT